MVRSITKRYTLYEGEVVTPFIDENGVPMAATEAFEFWDVPGIDEADIVKALAKSGIYSVGAVVRNLKATDYKLSMSTSDFIEVASKEVIE